MIISERNIGLMLAMALALLPAGLQAQEPDREQMLADDIQRLGDRAVRDRIISEEERSELLCFVRDSLPEGTDLKVRALEQIRDELDEKYSEKVRQARELLDEAGYIGSQMLPGRLYEPEGFVSPEARRAALVHAALAGASIDKNEIMKHVKPLPMKSWLMTILRMLFGAGVNQGPERWDYTAVPQMGGLYYIILPGGQPDESWRDAPKMVYDPHPDKHFRR